MDTFLKQVIELPLLKPLLALLKSRKFLIAVGTLAVNMLIAQNPQLESQRETLMTIVTLVGTVLVTSIAAEDVAKSRPKAEVGGQVG